MTVPTKYASDPELAAAVAGLPELESVVPYSTTVPVTRSRTTLHAQVASKELESMTLARVTHARR